MSEFSDKTSRVVIFPRQRRAMSAMLSVASNKNIVHGLIEVNVTRARRLLQDRGLSFTGFIAACVARAVSDNPRVHAMRLGRKRLVIYEDVDVNILVEHTASSGKLPTPYIARAANRMTVQDIHNGIRAAQGQTAEQSFGPARWMPYLPGFLLRFLFRILVRQPRLLRRFSGTVALSAVGMFGGGAGWGIPIPLGTLMVTLGGIGPKQVHREGKTSLQEFLSVTVSFDHDIVDGAPAARFTQRLKELVEAGYGLETLDSTGRPNEEQEGKELPHQV